MPDWESSTASASATVRATSAEYTPNTPARAPAGFVSGPRTLKIVRVPSSRRTGAACFIAGWCSGANMKPKPSVSIDSAIRTGDLLEVEAERLQHVRGAGDGAHRAVAVLRDRCARSGRDDRRGRGDVERARAVAARSHDVDDVRPRRVHGQHVGAHRLGAAGDLVGALALRAQGHEEAADLSRGRIPGHDLAHDLARLVAAEVVAVEERLDRGLDHRARVSLTALTSRSRSASSLYGPIETRRSVVSSQS